MYMSMNTYNEYIYIYVMCINLHTHIYICTCMHTYVNEFTNMDTHSHTYIHT